MHMQKSSTVPISFLVDELAVEGNADGGQEEASVLVGGCGCVDDDVATGDHLRRVPGELLECFAERH